MPAHVSRSFAIAFLAMVACATAGAQSFISFTTPDPVGAGRPFRLTVAGLLVQSVNQPVPTVTVEGPQITITLGRDCGFPSCPRTAFRTQIVSMPGLPAGTYVARIYEGSTVSSANADIQSTFTIAGANYQGLWWNGPAGSQPGWGLSIDHQGDILFATWYTYDESGAASWFAMPDLERTDAATYSGTVYRTTGPAFDARPWDPSDVTVTPVGTATLAFANDRTGTFSYTIDGKGGSNTITREIFSSPVATCVATP